MPGGAELQASHDLRPGGVPRTSHSGTELFRRSGVVECLLRSILECAHQRGAKEQLRPKNGDRQSQRGRGISWRGPSAYFPTVNLESGVQRDHAVFKYDPDLELPTNIQTSNLFLGGLSTAWEVDLWGRIRRSAEAANAEYLATEEGRRGLMLALITEVAQNYLELVELDGRLAVARDSRDAFESTHTLFSK